MFSTITMPIPSVAYGAVSCYVSQANLNYKCCKASVKGWEELQYGTIVTLKSLDLTTLLESRLAQAPSVNSLTSALKSYPSRLVTTARHLFAGR